MHITAVIAEYNPFHNGHLYQLEQIRYKTDADAILVLMSGDFVQRGTPAIFDKYTRTRMALSCGVDIVLELPVYYATGSAEYFAKGSIAILNELNCIDTLCFGCETDDLELLKEIASVLSEESPSFQAVLQNALKKGRTFPAAREEAVWHELSSGGHDISLSREVLSELLGSPNNILALEYLKQLIQTSSTIRPYAIKREGDGYLDTELNHVMSSATAIRNHLSESNTPDKLTAYMPPAALAVLKQAYGLWGPLYPDDFNSMLQYKLICGYSEGFGDYIDCNRDLSNKIGRQLPAFHSFCEMAEKLWSPNLTTSRIYRCLTHILLDLRKQDLACLSEASSSLYARILGIGDQSNTRTLCSTLKSASRIPLFSKVADVWSSLSPVGKACLEKELQVSALYRAALVQKYSKKLPVETRQPFLKI